MRFERVTTAVIASFLCLAACNNGVEQADSASSICVDIPNGQYFQFAGGRLVAVTPAQLEDQERPSETARRIGVTLAGMGYPWVSLNWDGQIAVVSGLALDENTRSDAFIAAKSVFDTDPIAGPLVQRVVNNMSVRDPEGAIALRLTEELSNEGLSWLRIEMAGNVATLAGTAPNADVKDLAYRAGRALVESDLNAGEIVNIVVDAIAVRGEDTPVGAALIDLKSDPSVDACNQTFAAIMRREDIAFVAGEAIIENSSARLLDAATGAALLCGAFDVEIAGHVPSSSEPASSVDLSQRRASAVKDYLMAYGAEPEALTARGYGERATPTDVADAEQAPERAIEFIVRARTN